MSLAARYLFLCVAGLVLPYWQFVPWLFDHGFDSTLFLRELFANRIGGFFAMDVLVSAVALMTFIRAEGSRLAMRNLWAPVVGTLLVGVSFGLPLFLLLRERAFRLVGSRDHAASAACSRSL